MRPFVAALRLAVVYAVLGVLGVFALAFLAGGEQPQVGETILLVVPLAFAAVIVVAVAALTERALRAHIEDDQRRLTLATMVVAALIILSGVLAIGSLGLAGVATAALLALVTHLVLKRSVE